MMLLTLDNLAHRYQLLPSEALERASTFDLHVLDLSAKWVKYQQQQADDEASGKKPKHNLSKEQMMDMIKRVREKA
jgi:hypothetical protein